MTKSVTARSADAAADLKVELDSQQIVPRETGTLLQASGDGESFRSRNRGVVDQVLSKQLNDVGGRRG